MNEFDKKWEIWLNKSDPYDEAAENFILHAVVDGSRDTALSAALDAVNDAVGPHRAFIDRKRYPDQVMFFCRPLSPDVAPAAKIEEVK